MSIKRLTICLTLAAAAVFAAPPASADAIDGHWCFTDGRFFTIDGPQIVTPGGQRHQGIYDRHGFDYTVPAGEQDAGAHVHMDMMDEDTVQLSLRPPGGAAGPVQVWIRCSRPVS